jgi:hypothetical protein
VQVRRSRFIAALTVGIAAVSLAAGCGSRHVAASPSPFAPPTAAGMAQIKHILGEWQDALWRSQLLPSRPVIRNTGDLFALMTAEQRVFNRQLRRLGTPSYVKLYLRHVNLASSQPIIGIRQFRDRILDLRFIKRLANGDVVVRVTDWEWTQSGPLTGKVPIWKLQQAKLARPPRLPTSLAVLHPGATGAAIVSGTDYTLRRVLGAWRIVADDYLGVWAGGDRFVLG